MASHLPAPCIAALLLLLTAAMAIIRSDASYNMLEKDRREAHLEPADEAGYNTSIVLLEPPAAGSQDMDVCEHRHQSFLPSLTTSLGERRLRHSYCSLVHGFSARLTKEEVEVISTKPGFIRAFPNFIRYTQTTWYPMGRRPSTGPARL